VLHFRSADVCAFGDGGGLNLAVTSVTAKAGERPRVERARGHPPLP